MARPKKQRKLPLEVLKQEKMEFAPINSVCLDYVVLDKDELEAIKLKDLRCFEQKKASKLLGISQPTFHRLLLSARKKLADAIINKKEIVVK